jgi:hypothetical protein
MRIEYQGQVQAKTYYMHVGYLSAGLAQGGDVHTDPLSGVYAGAGVLLLVLALIAARRVKSTWRWWIAVFLLLAALGSGLLAYSKARYVVISPQYYQTLYRMEELSAATEAWIDQNGRVPTVAEWQAMFPTTEMQDGWGKPLRYSQLAQWRERCLHCSEATWSIMENYGYVIWWPVLNPDGDSPAPGELTNWHFGGDGLFGPADDDYVFQSALKYKRLDPIRYPHGRTARTGGIAHAH